MLNMVITEQEFSDELEVTCAGLGRESVRLRRQHDSTQDPKFMALRAENGEKDHARMDWAWSLGYCEQAICELNTLWLGMKSTNEQATALREKQEKQEAILTVVVGLLGEMIELAVKSGGSLTEDQLEQLRALGILKQ